MATLRWDTLEQFEIVFLKMKGVSCYLVSRIIYGELLSDDLYNELDVQCSLTKRILKE